VTAALLLPHSRTDGDEQSDGDASAAATNA
jgi:hypothetical protein